MKITFCMPGYNRKPIGGYKMVYEYANRLVEKGHDVSIVFVVGKALNMIKVPNRVKLLWGKGMVTIFPRWFKLDKRIKRIAVLEIKDKYIPDSEVIFATGIATAEPIKNLSKSKGRKFYLIQDFENWRHNDSYVFETYRYGLKNIVIASWLKEIVDKYSKEPSVLIKNAIDTKEFKINIKPEDRYDYSIAALYHIGEYKGSKYTIETLIKLKEKYPKLRAILFGNPERPSNLPKWIEYVQRATREEVIDIYNSSAVFMCTSIKEGFGLTGAESMACGCAFVSTDYQGVHEYAIHNQNALLSEINRVDLIVENIEKIFENRELRFKLAYKGNNDIQKLSWEISYEKFEKALKE